MHVFKRALHLKKLRYRKQLHNVRVGEQNLRRQVQWKCKKLREAEFKAAHLEPLKRQAQKQLVEITALKVENQRLRDKQMQELEDNCGQITQDPVPRLKLEVEKLEQQYHKMLQEIEWRDNVIGTLKQVKQEREADGLETPKNTTLNRSAPKDDRKLSSHQSVAMLELEKHNTELETRVANLHRDNECLRAEVDEAEHW